MPEFQNLFGLYHSFKLSFRSGWWYPKGRFFSAETDCCCAVLFDVVIHSIWIREWRVLHLVRVIDPPPFFKVAWRWNQIYRCSDPLLFVLYENLSVVLCVRACVCCSDGCDPCLHVMLISDDFGRSSFTLFLRGSAGQLPIRWFDNLAEINVTFFLQTNWIVRWKTIFETISYNSSCLVSTDFAEQCPLALSYVIPFNAFWIK